MELMAYETLESILGFEHGLSLVAQNQGSYSWFFFLFEKREFLNKVLSFYLI